MRKYPLRVHLKVLIFFPFFMVYVLWQDLLMAMRGKRLVWLPALRIFCDGGQPRFTWLPRFRRLRYDPHWEMRGFAMYLWGREFNFSFGYDRKGLYK